MLYYARAETSDDPDRYGGNAKWDVFMSVGALRIDRSRIPCYYMINTGIFTLPKEG